MSKILFTDTKKEKSGTAYVYSGRRVPRKYFFDKKSF